MIAFFLFLVGINPFSVGDCFATPYHLYRVTKVGKYGVLAVRSRDEVYFTLSELKYVGRADCVGEAR